MSDTENTTTPQAETPASEKENTTTTKATNTKGTTPAGERSKEISRAKNNALTDIILALIVIGCCVYLIVKTVLAKELGNEWTWIVLYLLLTAYFIYNAIRSSMRPGWIRARQQAEYTAVNDLLRLSNWYAQRTDFDDKPAAHELRLVLAEYLDSHKNQFDLSDNPEAKTNATQLLNIVTVLDLINGEENVKTFEKYAKNSTEHPKSLGQVHALYESHLPENFGATGKPLA